MNLLRELEHFIISINKFLATTLLKGIVIKKTVLQETLLRYLSQL